MGDSLPWTEYEKVYNKQLKNDTVGASNRPGRMVIAALIIKHKLGLSDEETILAIQENPYMQYMCGLTEYSDRPISAACASGISSGAHGVMTIRGVPSSSAPIAPGTR